MTFKIKRTQGQGVEFEVKGGAGHPLAAGWGLPAIAYRIAARRVIDALLEENRALRHNKMRTLPAHVILARQPVWLRIAGTTLKRLAPEEDT